MRNLLNIAVVVLIFLLAISVLTLAQSNTGTGSTAGDSNSGGPANAGGAPESGCAPFNPNTGQGCIFQSVSVNGSPDPSVAKFGPLMTVQGGQGGQVNGPIYPSDFIFHKTVRAKQSKLCMPSTQGMYVCAPVGDWIDADWTSTRIAAAAGLANVTQWGFVQSAAIRRAAQTASIAAIGKAREILNEAQNLIGDSETMTDLSRSGELPGAATSDINAAITAANEAQPVVNEFSKAIDMAQRTMFMGDLQYPALARLSSLQLSVQMQIGNMQSTNPFLGPRMVGGNFFNH